jgi:hypothetical protein
MPAVTAEPTVGVTRTGDTRWVRMVTLDGRWRVEQITVQRGGRTLVRLRVSTFGGVFVAEVADVEQLAALGEPLAELVEENPGQPAAPPPKQG